MTATFNPTLADNVSKIRYLLGDTDTKPNACEFEDETYNFEFADKGTVKKAAASMAWALVAKYSRLADVTIDDQLTRYSKVHDQYLALATRLQAEANAEGATPDTDTAATSYGGVIVTGLDDCRGPLDGCWPC